MAGIVAALVLAGCEAGDPLEPIRQQQAAGDFAGSLETLRKLIEQQPKDPETNYLYGVALLYTSQPSLAFFPLRQAMEDPAWLISAGMQVGQAGLITGDFNEVVNATTRILEKHPEEAQALLFRAQARAHWRQEPELALADANRVLELQPDMLEVYEPKILALLAMNRQPEAREVLVEAGRRLSGTEAPPGVLAWHCSTTAVFAAEAKEVDAAREGFEKCLAEYPTDSTVVANALEFFDAHHEFESSLELLRVAHEKAPDERVFRVGYATRLQAAAKAAEGEALLRDATEADDPALASIAWVDLANYRHAMREHASAAEAWERAIEKAREVGEVDPQLLFQYADALVVSGQPDRALEVAKDIPVPAQQRLIVGRVAQERGQPAKALEEFDAAIKLWPNNPFARYYTALAAEQVGDFDRALEEYRYSIRSAVGATDARTRAARLLIAEGQLGLAYQLLFLDVGKAPLEPEGELLSMFLMARVANPKQLQDALTKLRKRDLARYVQALARGAEGAAEASGPRGALNLLRSAPGIDYTNPASRPVLRALVRFAHEAKQPGDAERIVTAGLKAHPDAPAFHALRGYHLELGGAADAARAAYQRAIELAPQNADALAGLARLTLASDPMAALALFDRAAGADTNDVSLKLGAARALRASGQLDEASRRLDVLLHQHPYEGEVAAEQVALDLERNEVSPKTLERAKRAARFGGGVAALDQLSEVHQRLDQPAEAARVAERARHLRERQEAGSGGQVPGEQKAPDREEPSKG